jgi:hypothetical protein
MSSISDQAATIDGDYLVKKKNLVNPTIVIINRLVHDVTEVRCIILMNNPGLRRRRTHV